MHFLLWCFIEYSVSDLVYTPPVGTDEVNKTGAKLAAHLYCLVDVLLSLTAV